MEILLLSSDEEDNVVRDEGQPFVQPTLSVAASKGARGTAFDAGDLEVSSDDDELLNFSLMQPRGPKRSVESPPKIAEAAVVDLCSTIKKQKKKETTSTFSDSDSVVLLDDGNPDMVTNSSETFVPKVDAEVAGQDKWSVSRKKRKLEEAPIKEESKKERNVRHNMERRLGEMASSGKFSNLEVLVYFEGSFMRNSIGHAVSGAVIGAGLDFAEERNFLVKGMVAFGHRRFLSSSDNPKSCALKAKPGKKEPAIDSSEPPSMMSNALIIFWDAEDFVERLSRAEDKGFPSLRKPVQAAIRSWKRTSKKRPPSRFTKENPKVILILVGVEARIATNRRELNKAFRKGDQIDPRSLQRCSLEGLQDALSWLLISCNCESYLTSEKREDFVELFSRLQAAVVSSVHYRLPSALEVLALYKKQKGISDLAIAMGPHEHEKSKKEAAVEKLKLTWMHMLSCVMSETSARNVVKVYPSMMSLVKRYNDEKLTEAEKELLLENIIYDNERRGPKLSRAVYRLLTADSPHVVVK